MANRRPRPAPRTGRRPGSPSKSGGGSKSGGATRSPSASVGGTATRGRVEADGPEAAAATRGPAGLKPADPKKDVASDARDEGSRSGSADGRPTPRTLQAAAAVAGLEALAGLGVGGWLTVEAFVQHPRGLAIAASAGVFVLAIGVGLGFLAWGLFNRRRWSRGPTVATQLIMLPIGYEFLSGSTTPAGVGMLVAAVLTLVLVLAPPSTAVFRA